MAQFKLDRFTYKYRKDWEAGISYALDDIITVNGNVYYCTRAHTSNADFYFDYLYTFTYPAPYSASDSINAAFDFSADAGGSNTTVDGTGIQFTVTRTGDKYSVTLTDGGRNYVTKERFTIPGDQLGGVRVTNDAIVEISTVDNETQDNLVVPGVVQSLTVTGTAATTKWEVMSEGYKWTGAWAPSTSVTTTDPETGNDIITVTPKRYFINDLVEREGNIWRCVQGHTASTDTDFGLSGNVLYWTLHVFGSHWESDWQGQTAYQPGDVVRYGGNVWRCITGHTSGTNVSGLSGDVQNWSQVASSDDWLNEWTSAVNYKPKDLVRYGGYLYRANSQHTSTTNFENELDTEGWWDLVLPGIEYKGNWVAPTAHVVGGTANTTKWKLGDLIRISQEVYVCTQTHTVTGTDTETADPLFKDYTSNWLLYVAGMALEDEWAETINYQPGDIVMYGGYTYYCKTFNIAQNPTTAVNDWDILSEWYNFKQDYNASTPYKVGDVVRNNGYLYWAVVDSTGEKPDSGTVETYKVTVKNPGSGNRYYWDDNLHPDQTFIRGNTYVFDQSHPSNDGHPIYPADAINGFLNTGAGGNEQFAGVQTVYVLDDRIVATVEDYNSGFNAATIRQTRVKIEADAPATLYFACYNHSGMSGTQVISISGSTYWDLLMPGVSFRGPWDDFAEDSSINLYELGDIALWAGTAYQCIRSHTADSVGSRPDYDVSQTTSSYWKVYVQGIRTNVLAKPGDIKTYSAGSNERKEIGDLGTVLKGLPQTNADSSLGQGPEWDLLGASPKTIYVSSFGVDAPDKGASLENPFKTIKYALDWILSDQINRAPATVFVATGEYEEILPLKIPSNVAIVGDELRSTRIKPAAGYEGIDMFHVRNGCGIRNCTLSGLVGTLGATNGFGTKRPTNGGPSFVSLDPGTGPTDSTVWVTNKSTYVQNVSTFGTECVGMKVDGSLHNGGNRSIVANDFTQVISGGIGMWITNGGLSELVSVFTYYCHIGYLAETGGKIRATNGNNSYGDFGSVAEGYDLTETPITANINNRKNGATVANVLTDLDNEIYLLGYSHAGQSYTSADIDAFSGTGSGLEVEFTEFRNKALSQIRLLDPGDSTTPGGSGFSITTGQAQQGDATSITLSATDIVEDSSGVYDGKRIFITQGKGKGQYGYIQNYDPSTKIAYVLKESDGTAGWDHWIPGTPIETSLGDTAFYQIEPRVEFNKPPFASTAINVNTPLDYKKVRYGNGKYVAIAQSSFGSAVTPNFISSSDGVAWSQGTFDGSNIPQNSGSWSWQDLAYGGGKWAAVAKEGIVAVSSDGENWTLHEVTNDSTTVQTRHIAYGDNPTIEQTFKVTVSVPGDNPLYHFDGAVNTAPDIEVVEGNTYTFNQNDTSNTGCPIYFSLVPEGINASGNAITDGIKYFLNNVQVADLAAYVAGFDAANTRKVTWTVPAALVGTPVYYVNYNSTGSGVQSDSSYAIVRVDGRSEWLVTADGSPEYFQSLDDGVSWTLGNLPSYQSYDGGVKAMTYGSGTFVAISGDWDSSKQRIYTKTPGNTEWVEHFTESGDMSNISSLTYGNNIFVATMSGSDSVWINPTGGLGKFNEYTSTLPSTGNWIVDYGQGVYVAFKPNSTDFAISENALVWDLKTLPITANWTTVGIGTPNNSNKFILMGSGSPLQGAGEVNAVSIQAGRRPFARMFVRNTRAGEFWIYDPGSGYESELANIVNNSTVTFGRNTADTADVYTIDSVENATLTLTEGRKYIYDLSDESVLKYGGAVVDGVVQDNPHPMLFYSDLAKTTVYEDNVRYILGSTSVSRATYLADFDDYLIRKIEIEVQYDAPSTLYYGSSTDASVVQSITVEETDNLSMTVSDPLATADPFVKLRISNGVLPQPSFRDRGTKFRSATATVTGDGFADIFQTGNKLNITGLTREPGPGANLEVTGISGKIYLVTKVTNLTGDLGDFSATIQISPTMGVDESPDHNVAITIREEYSQVRLTFHDFLDIGTGNQNSTRYPIRYLEGYTDADANTIKQFNETTFADGGRVFYSSTDQDGNFRVGELFEVEQASGIITINADQFDLSGLSELSLGGVTLGGTGAVIREFSIDPLFTGNSDSIVPTQKAVSAYVKSRITGGGSAVNVNKVTAGVITSGDSGQGLETTDGVPIQMKAKLTFEGGVDGDMAARAFFAFGTDIAISDDFGGQEESGGDYNGYGA